MGKEPDGVRRGFGRPDHMAVGAGDDDLMVHVGKDGVEEALGNGARPATMGERTMGGVVLVAAADLPDADALDAWVGSAVERALAKPPKKPKESKGPKKTGQND